MKRIISVIGGRVCSKEVEHLALNLGKNLGKVADYLVTGGLSGVMKAVNKGFQLSGGVTIGILPSYDKGDANPYIDICIPTGLGLARNVLVVKSADIVIALPGQAGTLSEIAYCLQFGIPVISLKSWQVKGTINVKSVDQAVKKVEAILGARLK